MMVQIREANTQDAGLLAELLKDIGWFESFNNEPLEVTRQRVRVHVEQCRADKSHSIFVAESSDRNIVGYGSVHWLPYLFCRDRKDMFLNCSFANPRAGKASVESFSRPSKRRRRRAAVCDCP
jgi:hypothetical protein